LVTFLFWNVRNKDLGGLAARVVEEHRVDVILLAECMSPAGFLESLNRPLSAKFNYHVINPERRIEIYSRFPNKNVGLLGDIGGLSAFRLLPFDGEELLVIGARLLSKKHLTPEDQTLLCTENRSNSLRVRKRRGPPENRPRWRPEHESLRDRCCRSPRTPCRLKPCDSGGWEPSRSS
jgi:hypothetical protein